MGDRNKLLASVLLFRNFLVESAAGRGAQEAGIAGTLRRTAFGENR